MGNYWNVKSYKYDNSFITGEVKSRGYFEFNMQLAKAFFTGKIVEFRNGIDLFGQIMDSKDLYYEFGLYDKSQMDFYLNCDDLIDGSNLRSSDDDETRYGMLIKADKILNALQQISVRRDNFSADEKSEELLELIELLKNAKDNNDLIHCYWIE